mgnify:CR=1
MKVAFLAYLVIVRVAPCVFRTAIAGTAVWVWFVMFPARLVAIFCGTFDVFFVAPDSTQHTDWAV